MVINMRYVVIVLCLLLAGCRGKRVVTEMTDTTRVTVDSAAFVSLRQSVGFAVDSCVEWAAVEFGDSGGWLRIDGGVLTAGGVKGFCGGRKSCERRLDFAAERLDSAAVRKMENRGVMVDTTGDGGTAASGAKTVWWWVVVLAVLGVAFAVMRLKLGSWLGKQ